MKERQTPLSFELQMCLLKNYCSSVSNYIFRGRKDWPVDFRLIISVFSLIAQALKVIKDSNKVRGRS